MTPPISKSVISSDKAPKALGPYSVANRAGDFVFCSGQLGLDPETNELADGVEAQTRQSLTNLQHVLAAAGTGLQHAVKTTVFLKNMADFAQMNAVYGTFFSEAFPARSTVEVAALPKGGLVEIELIAYVPA
jgi:2-iminobutanoate/2-iminopropanoate deaminase